MSTHAVIIIGSGFGGQCAAIRLKEQGIDDFILLERREFMGGTWCQNSYPGAAVDVQSPLYSIESEPYDWSQMFAEQDELERYTNHVIDKHRLRDRTRTHSNVEKIQWLEAESLWQIDVRHIQSGEPQTLKARFVINASGPLSTPVIPDFPGRDSFKGESFHTNNWNHDFDLRGKKVAIIGSGASAAQIIPAIAPDVGELHIFQRSPHWVMPRHDYQFKGWQRKLLRHKKVYRALREAIYWTLETRIIGFKYSEFMRDLMATRLAKKHIRQQIKDPELRKKVTPDWSIGCKRIILSNALYPAYCRDNVTLHSQDDSIDTITEVGINTTQGEQLELDLIIYSTGYDATDGVISYPVVGKGGTTLASAWEDFPRAYLGTSAPGFPNLFIVTGPNTGIGHTSAIFVIEAQMNYIMSAIKSVIRQAKQSVEVREDAEDRYTRHIHEEMNKTVWQNGGCNSWYKSKSGKVIAMFPGFSFTFRRWTKNFRSKDHIFS
ncbi:NAD(P)/FAD-dependent oxidoreductase [Bacterioplanoides sp. SCSIO 12839]|uniref:flavin-containing monooxygenase n=1 Tax=Bacterioplanoides sp. SCSIO 12839 TaxID=2829569 RepID=UPI002105782D|nr:NAD(P)/FAD-dependent oxidoreductase [Bacterioplanoides sp. SCSIO 12839]UTW47698.1 NAD(P)/FAD-dependent oxidoreductase [Bacterioplanoides sp. SCSIO 12839]